MRGIAGAAGPRRAISVCAHTHIVTTQDNPKEAKQRAPVPTGKHSPAISSSTPIQKCEKTVPCCTRLARDVVGPVEPQPALAGEQRVRGHRQVHQPCVGLPIHHHVRHALPVSVCRANRGYISFKDDEGVQK